MSGVYSGVQKHILDFQPTALYIHCAGHNLNLVRSMMLLVVSQKVQIFFTELQQIYTFFGHSIRRWDIDPVVFTGESEVTVERLNATRDGLDAI